MKKVVIIGGGFAGINCAKKLGNNKDLSVTLIDKRNYHLFQPLLYQVATAGLSPADIATPIRGLLSKYKNINVVMDEVETFSKEKKVVITKNNDEYAFDYLVLASGARNFFFNQPWDEYSLGLKNIEEATSIRKKILRAFEKAESEKDPEKKKAYLTFVVVGGGPTGVELAGSIAEIARFTLARDFKQINSKQARVILIEAGKRLLPSFSESLSETAKEDLEELGVNVWLETRVSGMEENLLLMGDDKLRSHNIIWAAGVKASPLGEKLSQEYGLAVDRGGRVPIEKTLHIKDDKSVYVLGDLAHFETKNSTLPGLASVAIQQGKACGDNILLDLKSKKLKPFVYFDKGQMATIGRRKAVVEFSGFKISGTLAWMMWLFVHIYYLSGFHNKILVFLQWAWSYSTYKKGARII